MNSQAIIKTFPFAGFDLHQLFFKKITVRDFEAVADTLAEYMHTQEASLIQLFMVGPEKEQKPWNKACMQTFGEINWPLTWINLPEKQPECSLCVTCISGQTVKTIIGNEFVSKIIETPDSRLGIVGAGNKPVNAGSPLAESLVKGLLFTGCESSHLLKAWIPTRLSGSKDSPGKPSETEAALPIAVLPFDPTYKGEIIHSLWALKTRHPEISIQKSTKQNTYGTFHTTVISHWESKSLMLSGNFSTSENTLEQVINFLSEFLKEKGFDWNHCVRGVSYCHPAESEKALKDLFKSLKIPLAPWLFVPGPSTGQESQFWFDADLVWEKSRR
ncbi:MAG: hypothetical protein AB7S69_15165 [Salinivirgaceae bacterium]